MGINERNPMTNQHSLLPSLTRSFTLLVFAIALTNHGECQTGGRVLESRLRELDENSDGVLSETEFGRSQSVFKSIDKDLDERLTLTEIRSFLQSGGKIGPQISPTVRPVEKVGAFDESMPVNLASCRAAARYSASSNGHAVLVMIDGETVYETYNNGWGREQPHRLASGTKSFAGVAAAIAADEGLLNFDEPVSETITEWREDPRLSRVTIGQLLTLTSGIDPGENSVVLPYSEVIDVKSKHKPGTKFEYGPNPFQIFGALMNRKLASANLSDDYLSFLRSRVFDPIGMKVGIWRRTNSGDPHVPSGAFITAAEWAKFGKLLCDSGRWNDQQIIQETLLKQLTEGTKANPAYGTTFWLGVQGGVDAGTDAAGRTTSPDVKRVPFRDLFMAAGAGKQRLYVIPSLRLVAVRFGETKGRRFRDDEFLKRLIAVPRPDRAIEDSVNPTER